MKALRVAAEVGLVALCLVPVGRQLVQDGASVGVLAFQLNPLMVIGAGLMLVLSSLFLPVALSAFTAGAPRPIGYRNSAVAYYASQPMKYLPGSFWVLPGRVMLLRRMGHDAAASTGGVLFELTTQALSAALVAAVLLGNAGAAPVGIAASIWLVMAGSLVLTVLLIASPALVGRIRRLPAPVRKAATRLAEIPLAARVRNTVVTIVANTALWLIMGASFYLLLVAGQPHLDLALLKIAIGVSTLSWLAGFLTPISPGGIGVREAAIVLLLAGLVSGPQATLVAVAARVLATVVEAAFAVAAWLIVRRQRSATGSTMVHAQKPIRQGARQRRGRCGNGRVAGILARRPLPESHP